ncbi:unnamed protein product [Mucor hiemalis]
MSTEVTTTVLATEPISLEAELQNCLTSIHESSRVASEINALEVKLNSLSSIKTTLVTGDNFANAALDQLNKTIAEVQTSINSKKAELGNAEGIVISGFIEVMTRIARQAEEKSGKVIETMREFQEKITSNVDRISRLEKDKMNVSEREEFSEKLNTLQEQLKAKQKIAVADMMGKGTDIMKTMTKQVDNFCERGDPDKISLNVYKKVMQTGSKTSTDNLESTIDKIVKKELDQHITPSNIQNIIQSLPEYELMQKAGQQLAQAPAATPSAPVDITNHPSLLAIKESVHSLTNQITELKQSNESTRTIVDAIRQNNISPSAATTNVDFQAAVKHMEKMEKEVTLIHNNIKMIETVVNLKSKEMEDGDLTVSRKRPRMEESSELTTFNKNSQDYLARLTDIETKHQKLLDFIVQCKDTVLDEQFPLKIEAAMSKIEQILMNHEKFIAFLIDPFSTTKVVSIPKDTTSTDMLSPSMVDAISQLVKETAEEIALPLQKKIKFLEDKLESRSS